MDAQELVRRWSGARDKVEAGEDLWAVAEDLSDLVSELVPAVRIGPLHDLGVVYEHLARQGDLRAQRLALQTFRDEARTRWQLLPQNGDVENFVAAAKSFSEMAGMFGDLADMEFIASFVDDVLEVNEFAADLEFSLHLLSFVGTGLLRNSVTSDGFNERVINQARRVLDRWLQFSMLPGTDGIDIGVFASWFAAKLGCAGTVAEARAVIEAVIEYDRQASDSTDARTRLPLRLTPLSMINHRFPNQEDRHSRMLLRGLLFEAWGQPLLERLQAWLKAPPDDLNDVIQELWEAMLLEETVADVLAEIKEEIELLPPGTNLATSQGLVALLDAGCPPPVMALALADESIRRWVDEIVDPAADAPDEPDPSQGHHDEATKALADGLATLLLKVVHASAADPGFLDELDALRGDVVRVQGLPKGNALARGWAGAYVGWLEDASVEHLTTANIDRVVAAGSDAVRLLDDEVQIADVVFMLYQLLLRRKPTPEVIEALIPLLTLTADRLIGRVATQGSWTDGPERTSAAAECLLRLCWLQTAVGRFDDADKTLAEAEPIFDAARISNPPYAESIDRGLTKVAAARAAMSGDRTLATLARTFLLSVEQEDASEHETRMDAIVLLGVALECDPAEVLAHKEVIQQAIPYALSASKDREVASLTRAQALIGVAGDTVATIAEWSTDFRLKCYEECLALYDDRPSDELLRFQLEAASGLLTLGLTLPRKTIERLITVATEGYAAGLNEYFATVAIRLGRMTADEHSIGTADRVWLILLTAEAILVSVAARATILVIAGMEAIGEHLRIMGALDVAEPWLTTALAALERNPHLVPGHAENVRINLGQLRLARAVDEGDLDTVRDVVRQTVDLFRRYQATSRDLDVALTLSAEILRVRSSLAECPRLIDDEVLVDLEDVCNRRSDADAHDVWLMRSAVAAERGEVSGRTQPVVGESEAVEALLSEGVIDEERSAEIRLLRVIALCDAGQLDQALQEATSVAATMSWATVKSFSFEQVRRIDWLGNITARIAATAIDAGDPMTSLRALELGRGQLLLASKFSRWLGSDLGETEPVAAEQVSAPIDLPDPARFLAEVRGLATAAALDESSAPLEQEMPFIGPAVCRDVARFIREAEAESQIPLTNWRETFWEWSPQELVDLGKRVGLVTIFWEWEDALHGLAMIDGELVVPLLVEPAEEGVGLARGGGDVWPKIEQFWRRTLEQVGGRPNRSWRAVAMTTGSLSRSAPRIDVLFESALDEMKMQESFLLPSLTYVPSLRLIEGSDEPRETDTERERLASVLHIGDWSNSLLGPWLEAAAIKRLDALGSDCLSGADVTVNRVADLVGGADVVVVSAHGIGAQRAGAGAAALLADRPLNLVDTLLLMRRSAPQLLILASCDLGLTDTQTREYDALSFASAGLAAGCKVVIAAMDAADDLPSAVLVSAVLRRVAEGQDSRAAFFEARREVREMTREQFEAAVFELLDLAYTSEGLEMPWPRDPVEKECTAELARLAADRAWTNLPFVCLAG